MFVEPIHELAEQYRLAKYDNGTWLPTQNDIQY
jgi:hypothetical protein